MTFFVGLPSLTRVNIDGCEIAGPKAERVEANQVFQIEDLTGKLWRVAEPDGFIGKVRSRQTLVEMLPEEGSFGRFSQSKAWIVVCMDEQMRFVFVIWNTRSDKLTMFFGDAFGSTTITDERRSTTQLMPNIGSKNAIQIALECNFMIATKEDSLTLTLKRKQAVDRTATVRTAIDIVAQKYERVFTEWTDRFKQCDEGFRAAMDVSYRDCSQTGNPFLSRSAELAKLAALKRIRNRFHSVRRIHMPSSFKWRSKKWNDLGGGSCINR